MKPIYIYKLLCPKTEQVRYIGKTVNIKRRLSGHISEAKRNRGKRYVLNWIRSLLKQDLKPLIEQVEVCSTIDWQEREQYWIEYYRNLNANLCNICDGGLGGTGTHILTKKERKQKAQIMSQTMSKFTSTEKELIWKMIQDGCHWTTIQSTYPQYTRNIHFQVKSGRVWKTTTKIKRVVTSDKLAPRSQFDAEDIIKIRQLKSTMYNKDIAILYGCHASVIQRITSGTTYH